MQTHRVVIFIHRTRYRFSVFFFSLLLFVCLFVTKTVKRKQNSAKIILLLINLLATVLLSSFFAIASGRSQAVSCSACLGGWLGCPWPEQGYQVLCGQVPIAQPGQ